MLDPDLDGALLRFFAHYYGDRDRGIHRTLSEYLHGVTDTTAQAAIAQDYLRLTGQADPPTAATQRPDGNPEPQGLAHRFEDLGLASSGGQADVHRGLDRVLGRRVAIKKFRHGWSRLARGRAEAEARLVSRLQHSGICRTIDLGLVDGTPWIVMDWIEGRTLAHVLREPGWSSLLTEKHAGMDRLLRMFVELADAVQCAHEHGVVHGDLKPSNIMMTGPEHERPVVLDFGCATAVRRGAATDESDGGIGTPAYMSPEQTNGEPLDAKSDVWSLGVVLLECLLGSNPLQRATDASTLAAVRLAELAIPEATRRHMPRDLLRVIRTALRVDPTDRYASARAFGEDLQRIRDNRPILAVPASLLHRTRQWIARNPGPTAIGLLLAMGILAVGIQSDRAEAHAQRAERHARTALAGQRQAAEERQRARAAAADAEFIAGRLLARRGRWSEARAAYERARDQGYDEVETSLGIVEILEADLQTDAAERLLAELAGRADLGSRRARVQLLDADLRVDRMADPNAKLHLAEAALDSGDLDPADAAFARALLADTVAEARTHLEAALEHDGYHHRSLAMYSTVLLACGDLARADQLATTMSVQFPASPAALNYAAFVATLRGDPERGAALRDRGQELVDEDTAEILDVTYDGARLLNRFAASLSNDHDAAALDVFDVLPLLARGQQVIASNRAFGSFRMCPALARHYLAIPTALQRRGTLEDKLRSVLEALEPAAADLGDSLLHYFSGCIHMQLGQPDLAEPVFANTAVSRGFLVPPALCRFHELDAQFEQFQRLAEPATEARTQIVARARVTLVALLDLPLAQEELLRGANTYALAFRCFDAAESLNLLWRSRSPGDPAARTLLAVLIHHRGDPAAAATVLRDVLADHPDHDEARDLLEMLERR